MNGGTTTIANPAEPNEEPKKFAFDYSYWSHDSFSEQEDGLLVPDGPKYADQARVFEELGKGVLTNAWEGYNSCLFAYGQTGSGKSFSMVGYGVNKGIVPIFCDQLFIGINQKKDEGSKAEYEVSFSMLEIYNEQVRDLLNPSSNKKGGLKVRESPKIGFYAMGLKQTPVQSYAEIQDRMDEGTRNRTVAATQMNATSSRAHTIVGIKFTQKSINDAGQEMAKTAICNLVDLAGSERAESTGATGDRLKEGAAINQSLSSLGNCIAALADKSKGKNVKVPYRDSVLTKLLKNALGGNSKTIMIAALSPADINYEETLSTLRYADRAKQIKNVAVVNEDPTEKLIRELKEENQRLMDALKKGGLGELKDDDEEEKQHMTEEEKEALRKELEEEMQGRLRDTEAEMEEMKKTWEEKLKQAQSSAGNGGEREKKEARKTKPHMYNLNMDNQLSGMIFHLLDQTSYKVGNNKADSPPDIVLNGLSIQKEHAAFCNEDGKVFVEKSSPEAKLLVNGEPVISKVELDHNDRIMFGSNHLYVFQHPDLQKANPNKYHVVTYEMAQEEIAQKNGFDMSDKQNTDDKLLQQDLIDMIPSVEEANAMSEELDKKVKFEIVMLSPRARGLQHGRTEVCVRVRNLECELEYVWDKDKFTRRKYLMQEMYQNFQEGEDWQLPDEKDPFTESPDTQVQIGSAHVYLQSLAYLIETKESALINNYQGQEQGLLDIELVPCDDKGKELSEADDIFVEDPKDLIGRSLNFVIKIPGATGIPNKYKDVHCRYKVFLDTVDNETDKMGGSVSLEFRHRKYFNYKVATSQLVDYLSNGMLSIQVWGVQQSKQSPNAKPMNTKMMVDALKTSGDNAQSSSLEKTAYILQVAALKKQNQRLEEKIGQVKRIVEVAERHNKSRVQTSVLKQVLNAPTVKLSEMAIAKVPLDEENQHTCDHQPSQSSSVCVLM
ncbi:putative kinesin-like protein KIF28P [Apostichopus japonicus]|uniref:Kinesin-like protein 6 n=1 Tax=Stichopus japonicus TaxID=307972 RepID=A0A2G8KFF1_STIJA|nr:putative kinesin-like protein KIF28P [Apostichopus japonicus]